MGQQIYRSIKFPNIPCMTPINQNARARHPPALHHLIERVGGNADVGHRRLAPGKVGGRAACFGIDQRAAFSAGSRCAFSRHALTNSAFTLVRLKDAHSRSFARTSAGNLAVVTVKS